MYFQHIRIAVCYVTYSQRRDFVNGETQNRSYSILRFMLSLFAQVSAPTAQRMQSFAIIKRGSQRFMQILMQSSCYIYPIVTNIEMFTDFRRNYKYKISRKPVPWEWMHRFDQQGIRTFLMNNVAVREYLGYGGQ